MPDIVIACSHCGAAVQRDDIRQGSAIATQSVAFCCECTKALTEEERSKLLPVSLASADTARTKRIPGPDSMAIRNVVAKRLGGKKPQPRHMGMILLGVAIAALVVIVIAAWSARSSSSANVPSAPADQAQPGQP